MTRLAEQSRELGRIADWLPGDRPDEITPDSEGRRRLSRMGWSSKAGVLFAPSSLGTSVPMYPQAVLFGDAEDAREATFFRKTRQSLQPEYASAFRKWILLVARTPFAAQAPAAALSALDPWEKKALVEGQDDAGGYLVPATYSAELLARVAQRAVIRPYARIVPLAGDTLTIPALQAHTTSGSTYASSFVADWFGETPAFTDVDPKFSKFSVAVKKLRAVTRLANDFVADSATDVLAWLAENGASNIAVVEDQGFIGGIGAGLQPSGILNAGVATVDVEGSTANLVINTNAATGSAPKIKDLAYALPSPYARGARWIARRSIEGKVRKLVDFQNRFQFPAPGLEGGPLDNSDAMPDDGADGNKVLLFGDPSAYVIAQRTQISVRVLRDRFGDTDQTGFVLIERLGGALFNPDAFRVGVV